MKTARYWKIPYQWWQMIRTQGMPFDDVEDAKKAVHPQELFTVIEYIGSGHPEVVESKFQKREE